MVKLKTELEKKKQQDKLKQDVGKEASRYVKDGMVVGLGTGSTVKHTVIELGKKNLDIIGIPTSKSTERLARRVGIKLSNPNKVQSIDVSIDGADEVDSGFNLIKGGGGALTREKIIASMTKTYVVVVDQSKVVNTLGSFPLPLEVLDLAKTNVSRTLLKLGALSISERKGKTDNGNTILDAQFSAISNPVKLEKDLNNIPGVIENGIFPKRYVDYVLVSTKKGVKTL
ncbi:ribose-5-phosphate isomerase RpiA [Candidatus Undinarchaeota archaeon]